MNWLAWGVVSNLAIARVEYLNRTGGYAHFWDALPHTWPCIVLAQLGLFMCWRDCPNMLVGWACFTLGNSCIRVLSTRYAVGEPLNTTVLAGVGLMTIASGLVAYGYRK